jgi:hypothetical protein
MITSKRNKNASQIKFADIFNKINLCYTWFCFEKWQFDNNIIVAINPKLNDILGCI